jgi:hypothetical protein
VAPRLQAFLLAEAVYQDIDTGKHVIAGTFARLFVPKLPGELGRPVSAYCALTGVIDSVQIAMQFETDAGEVLIRSSPTTLTCTDPRLLVEFGFAVPSLPFPGAGWYQLVLLVGDQRFATLALEVMAT